MPRRPPGSGVTSVWFRPAPAPRQPAPAFSRDEITQAAIDLADRGGLGAVSMRRIAARIGSAPTSLYWYVSNKEELYELMVDACIGLIPLPEQPSGDWRADLAAIARAARVTLSAHPWFAQLGIHPIAGPADPAVRRCDPAIVRRPRPRPRQRGQHPGHDQQLHLRLRAAGSGLAAAARTSRTRRRTLRCRGVRAAGQWSPAGRYVSRAPLGSVRNCTVMTASNSGWIACSTGSRSGIGRAGDQDS